MNIYGEDAKYIRNIIFTMSSMRSDDIRGMVINRTLYFIENWCILYEFELPEYFPIDLVCCFWKNESEPGSFIDDISIIDKYELYQDISSKLSILGYTMKQPIYVNDNCLDDNQFQELSKYRPDDGSMKYFIDSSLQHRSFTMLNKSFFKLNKSDKLSVNVYEADYNRLVFKYTLFKKKFGKNINIYTMSLDLQ